MFALHFFRLVIVRKTVFCPIGSGLYINLILHVCPVMIGLVDSMHSKISSQQLYAELLFHKRDDETRRSNSYNKHIAG